MTVQINAINGEQNFLSENEIRALYELDLSDNPQFDLYRDVFLVGVYTQLRYSDYSIISEDNISEKSNGTRIIKLREKKTGLGREVNIRAELEVILQKYRYDLPKTYAHKLNKFIKEIAKLAGINKPITQDRFEGSRKVSIKVPKYETIDVYTARWGVIPNPPTDKMPQDTIRIESENLIVGEGKTPENSKEKTGKNIAINGKWIATTSIDSYHSKDLPNKMGKQALSVIKYLQKVNDATTRQLAKRLDIERTSVTRTIHNLQHKQGLVIITREDRCPDTNRVVRFYGLKTK